MDYLTVQYLEYRPELADLSPAQVGSRLQDAAGRLPLTHVLVGWDLPPALLEVCQRETRRMGSKLYRWHPLLTGDGVFQPQPAWQVVGAAGERIAGFKGMPEFTFVCPNHPAGRAALLSHLDDVLHSGQYAGLFLDRIRFPSPAEDPFGHLGCFCEHCRAEAAGQGLDLEEVRRYLLQLVETPQGCLELVDNLFRSQHPLLENFLRFRQRSVSRLLAEIAGRTHAAGLEVGLDCFAPCLTRMVGQNLPELGHHGVDWIKVMVYAHTLGPAGMPFELAGLASWLVEKTGMAGSQVMAFLGQASGLPLPVSIAELIDPGLGWQALQEEVRRGVKAAKVPLLAGIEMVDIPGVTHLDPRTIKSDLQAVRQAGPAGLALSWDLCWMPEEYLDLVSQAAVPSGL
jgi:hypothetical protein